MRRLKYKSILALEYIQDPTDMRQFCWCLSSFRPQVDKYDIEIHRSVEVETFEWNDANFEQIKRLVKNYWTFQNTYFEEDSIEDLFLKYWQTEWLKYGRHFRPFMSEKEYFTLAIYLYKTLVSSLIYVVPTHVNQQYWFYLNEDLEIISEGLTP